MPMINDTQTRQTCRQEKTAEPTEPPKAWEIDGMDLQRSRIRPVETGDPADPANTHTPAHVGS